MCWQRFARVGFLRLSLFNETSLEGTRTINDGFFSIIKSLVLQLCSSEAAGGVLLQVTWQTYSLQGAGICRVFNEGVEWKAGETSAKVDEIYAALRF